MASMRLTPAALKRLDAIAKSIGGNRTDIVERAARFLRPFAPRLAQQEDCTSFPELLERYWDVLIRQPGLTVDRLTALKAGTASPTALECCRIALALGLTEDEVIELVEEIIDSEDVVEVLRLWWGGYSVPEDELRLLSQEIPDLPLELLQKVRDCLTKHEEKSGAKRC